MGVHTRKRRTGKPVHCISFMVDGNQVQEQVGTDKRQAERLLSQRKREVKEGTYCLEAKSGAVTLKQYVDIWLATRTNRSKSDDRQRLRDHVVPILGSMRLQDIRPKHVQKLCSALKDKLRVKTAKNAYGTFRTLMRDARILELTSEDPCILHHGTWKESNPLERLPYSQESVVLLTTDERVTPDSRVFLALSFYTGMRLGEVSGRRFRDWDKASAPLGCLKVSSQYNGQPLKTDKPRKVPVHPRLRQILEDWESFGFELVYGRRPTADDWIVPLPSKVNKHRTQDSAYRAFIKSCNAVGVENLTLHSARHTLITWARRGGARSEVVETFTHNAKGAIIDQYTHWDWDAQCEAVSCLSYEPKLPVEIVPAVEPTAADRVSPAEQLIQFYDANYDASWETAQNMLLNGGGAGNRTASATQRMH